MSGIAQVLAQFGHVENKKKVLPILQADVSALRESWKSHIKQGLMSFDVATLERLDAATALKSLGMALAVESPDVDMILDYIDSDQSGFRDPSKDNELDERMLAAVNRGFREARATGFKALTYQPPFLIKSDDMESHEGDRFQHALSEYDTHINRHLPVPRLYTSHSFGKCQVRPPKLYDAIFSSDICMTRQQLADLTYAKDYDALEKLAAFKDIPASIQALVQDQMQSFDYLASLDARKRLLGSGEMTMTESRIRLESAFRNLGNFGNSQDVAPTLNGIKAFEFSPTFLQQGLQHTIDAIMQEYSRKPVSLSDPAAPQVYSQAFAALAAQGLEIDTTAIMAKERVDFCKAKDMKNQGSGLLPNILKGLGSPANNLVKGALMAAVQTFPIPEVFKHCDPANERQMKTLYEATGHAQFLQKLPGKARDAAFAMDMGL
ncbi:hypothetical protein IFT69_18165 [Pseudomonas putida]|nr:hypothetical protein [Pseudomonas putida]